MKNNLTIQEGMIFKSKRNGEFRIVKYNSYRDIVIQFTDCTQYTCNVLGCNIIQGTIDNPFYPRIYGKGYTGVGSFLSTEKDNNGLKRPTKAYDAWRGMLRRCFHRNEEGKLRDRIYEDVSVCETWYNFQTFAQWYINNHPNYEDKSDSYDLDKDLFGNYGEYKIYSPQTCCVLPHKLNTLLRTQTSRCYPELPQHVYKNDDGTFSVKSRTVKGRYMTRGLSLSEAIDLRFQDKKLHLIEAVKEYEHILPERTLAALYDFDYTREYDYNSIPED